MVSLTARVDTAHRDMIHDAQMDYYGVKLATCSSDRTIKIFEVKSNGQYFPITELHGHEGPVWQLSWSHPMYESLLASASYDHKVIIWKELSGKWSGLHEFTQHEASVNSVAWAPQQYGCMLASASSDKSIAIMRMSNDGAWDHRRISNAHEQGCNSLSWAPYNPFQADSSSSATKRIVSAGNDNLVKIWREKEDGEWELEKRLEGHSDWVRDVAWAPPLSMPQPTIASCSQDKSVIIWKQKKDTGEWERELLSTFPDVVWHVSWSLSGSILAVSCGDNRVTLWKESLDGKWACISDNQKSED